MSREIKSEEEEERRMSRSEELGRQMKQNL